jgi:hypothetical protein
MVVDEGDSRIREGRPPCHRFGFAVSAGDHPGNADDCLSFEHYIQPLVDLLKSFPENEKVRLAQSPLQTQAVKLNDNWYLIGCCKRYLNTEFIRL